MPVVSRELWIARQKWGALSVYLCEPYFDNKWSRECWTTKSDAPAFSDGKRWMELPEYLYSEITFENSPQKLSVNVEYLNKHMMKRFEDKVAEKQIKLFADAMNRQSRGETINSPEAF